VLREDPANDIFVDLEAEGMGDLLCDAYTAEFGIAATRLDSALFEQCQLSAKKQILGLDRPRRPE
jgi:hypothetical protein